MDPAVYSYIFLASIAGGASGALVMWNRKRTLESGENRVRSTIVLLTGTVASGSALVAFSKAFGLESRVFAVMVMILVTGWVAVVHSVIPFAVRQALFEVGPAEFALLGSPWTGVRAFGWLLRSTPLRHLGGPVFLARADRDPGKLIPGLHSAETIHLWALLFCAAWLLLWAVQGQWGQLLWGIAINIPLNLYPTLHLRYVNARVDRLLGRTARSGPRDSFSPGLRA